MIEPLRCYETEPFVERRASRRVEVTCAATIQTITMECAGHLVDISQAGARLRVEDAPRVGSTAILRWAGHEVGCTVVWVEGADCGVSFARPVAAEVVAQTSQINRVIDLPIASVSNIAQGQKRSAFRAALRSVEVGEPQ